MERLFRILASGWTSAALFALILLSGHIRNQTLRTVTFAVTALLVAAMFISVIPVFRNIRRTWRNFPDTQEYREYIAKRDAESAQNDKNKIEIDS